MDLNSFARLEGDSGSLEELCLDWAAGTLDGIRLAGWLEGWLAVTGVGWEGGWEAGWPRGLLELRQVPRVRLSVLFGGPRTDTFIKKPITYLTGDWTPEIKTED